MLFQPNTTQLEKNIQRVKQLARQPRLEAIEVIRNLYSPDKCRTDFLPYLAWTYSAPRWSSDWAEGDQREAIKQAFFINSHLGSVNSIRRAMSSAGFGEIEIQEGYSNRVWNGDISFDGTWKWGDSETDWALYNIKLNKPITIKQSIEVRKILKQTAPARSELLKFDFAEVANIWNGEIKFDGIYAFGGN